MVVVALGLIGGGTYGFYQSVLPNLRIVRHGVLWRSGQPNLLGLYVARWAGVKTLICLRDGDDAETKTEAEFARAHGMVFVQNQLRYSGENLHEAVSRFLEVVRDPQAQPVLVHCSRGKERTGVCSAVFRIEFDGWTDEQALREMYGLGFDRGTLPELEQFVSSYRASDGKAVPATVATAEPASAPPSGGPRKSARATP